MQNWDSNSNNRQQAHLYTETIKTCPLCSAQNPTTNFECFVCGWYGVFEQDLPEHIEPPEEPCEEVEQAIARFEWATMSRSARFWAMMRRILME